MGIDLENPRYKGGYGRPFGELCTRLRHENGEKINGVPCCYGLISEQTDNFERKCLTCDSFRMWND